MARQVPSRPLHAVDPAVDLALGLVLGDAVALLDAPDELVLLAVDDGDVVLGKLAPLFLDLAGHLLPVPFNTIPVHMALLSLSHVLRLRDAPTTTAFDAGLPDCGYRYGCWADFLCAGPFDCPHTCGGQQR